MTAEILSTRPEGGKTRVQYQFVEGQQIEGPYIEDRPTGENHQAWADTKIPPPPFDEVANMVSLLGIADATLFRDALVSEGVEGLMMDGRRFVRITGTKTLPRTLQSALVSRLGTANVNRIRNKLKAGGFEWFIGAYEFDKVTL